MRSRLRLAPKDFDSRHRSATRSPSSRSQDEGKVSEKPDEPHDRKRRRRKLDEEDDEPFERASHFRPSVTMKPTLDAMTHARAVMPHTAPT